MARKSKAAPKANPILMKMEGPDAFSEADGEAAETTAAIVYAMALGIMDSGINGGAVASALVAVAVRLACECDSQTIMAGVLRRYADLTESGMMNDAAGNA